MEEYKQIRQLVKEGNYHLSIHLRNQAIDREIDLSDIQKDIQRAVILSACEVELNEELNKFFCILKKFPDWITFVCILYPDLVFFKTVWPSKRQEIHLYKKKRKDFRRDLE